MPTTPGKSLSRASSRSSLSERPSLQRRFPRLLQVLRCTGGKLVPDLVVTLPSNITYQMGNYFKLLAAQRQRKNAGIDSDDFLSPNWDTTLPSDHNWRMKNYVKLLDEQKLKAKHGPLQQEVKPPRLDWLSDVPQEPEAKRPRRTAMPDKIETVWQAQDIIKAAGLLFSGNQAVSFDDEEEMRRVFTLLYDVFRYKTILKEALDETGFSQNHPEYKDLTPLIWLLFFDLHTRRFLPREHDDDAVCREALQIMCLTEIEDELWRFRVRLAAALARNRIKHRALRLNHLLPNHLRDERLLSVDEAPATGWVNTFLTTKTEIMSHLSELGISLTTVETTDRHGKFDHVCPKVISFPAECRANLARSDHIKSGKLILQDRAFCLAPAFMHKILEELSLRGTVAQSHVISPRATAYLATVLLDNEKIEKVLAFGTGARSQEYQAYLANLGVSKCELRPERWCDVPPDAELIESVVAVLATPPTSWTGIADPVDLVCSRSGDMDMLRALTQARRGRDALLLEEQRDTLRFCMSLPQVQVVVYESHSMSKEENAGMVNGAVECMNEWARQRHAEEQRLMQEQEEAEEKLNKAMLPGGTPAERQQREREAQEAQEALNVPVQVQVPPCDLFEVIPTPEMCPHGRECLEEDGCYIAYIQRKEIVGLDDKYMIKIAEARGLFGTEPGHKKATTTRSQKKKEDTQRSQSGSDRSRTRRAKIEVDRIAAHTHASWNRTCSSNTLPCERFNAHIRDGRQRRSDLRRALIRAWWHETYNYVLEMIPYWNQTPRARAACHMPILRLPRICPRRPFPIHTVQLSVDSKSEHGEFIQLDTEIRRNSC